MALPASEKYVWLNGELVPWEQATVHITTVGWSSIAGVFEGIKAYWNADEKQLYAYQFPEHYRRFAESMRVQRFRPAWTPAQLVEASHELLRANDVREDMMVRPHAFTGDVRTFGTHLNAPTVVLIWTLAFSSIFGTEKTFRVGVSSWTRSTDNQVPPRVKCFSNYQNSRLALMEAQQHGYDSAILLNPQGKVTEGPTACIFLVRDGTLITPPITSGILEGVTRRTIIQLAREALNVPTVEREVDRTELYVADEVFFCGTGAEITPISEVDGLPVGSGGLGPITRQVSHLIHEIVRGRDARFRRWVVPVGAAREVAAG